MQGSGQEDSVVLGLDDFAPLVGATFIADFGAEGTVELILEEATEQPTGNDHDIAFSLVFCGPLGSAFDQGLVPLTHDAIGTHDTFLVPISEGASGRRYQAIYTRLVGST